jgi:hypothetical protein
MYYRQLATTYSVRVALACTLFACAQVDRAVADSLPYQARVIVSGASVHSGPGDNFYPTDSLLQGDTVEVYREKPGGWLAIRPPAGSFSWVASHDLTRKDGGLAEAVKDGVASRIGSRLNDRHNAAQVRLKKGEAVEVLGEESFSGEKWCKIAPPAGEFRWIQASVVERTGPIQSPSATPASSTTPAAGDAKPIQQSSTTPAAHAAGDSGASASLPGSKPPDATAAAAPNGTSLPAGAATVAPAAAAAVGQPAANPAAGDLSHELAAIEIRLSRMAAAPTNLWNTERLERDCAQLQARAKTTAERDAVRATQEKINQFAQIGRRASPTASNVAQSGQPPITPLPGTVATGATSATAASGGPYDAVGILRPVVSRRPGAPQFALVDERGQVVSFVTSTPDLNLQPYLGRRVGVVGNRGYIPEFQRSNVTAARVAPLNDRMIR